MSHEQAVHEYEVLLFCVRISADTIVAKFTIALSNAFGAATKCCRCSCSLLGSNLLNPIADIYAHSLNVGPAHHPAVHDHITRTLDDIHEAGGPFNSRNVGLKVRPILAKDANEIWHLGVVERVFATLDMPTYLGLFLYLLSRPRTYLFR